MPMTGMPEPTQGAKRWLDLGLDLKLVEPQAPGLTFGVPLRGTGSSLLKVVDGPASFRHFGNLAVDGCGVGGSWRGLGDMSQGCVILVGRSRDAAPIPRNGRTATGNRSGALRGRPGLHSR